MSQTLLVTGYNVCILRTLYYSVLCVSGFCRLSIEYETWYKVQCLFPFYLDTEIFGPASKQIKTNKSCYLNEDDYHSVTYHFV